MARVREVLRDER